MKRLLPILMVLAACQSEAQDDRGSGNEMAKSDVTCGAEAFEERVGQVISDTMDWPEGARIVYPWTAITMDHRPDRLNVILDENGTIVQIRCG